jgi:hypothetical protein
LIASSRNSVFGSSGHVWVKENSSWGILELRVCSSQFCLS